MANLNDVLEALNTEEGPISVSDLAKKVKGTTGTTRKQLHRLKDKGYVEGSGDEGWEINDTGRDQLGKPIPVSMEDEGVTPRQKFESIGRQIGIAENRLILATDIVWSQDYNDIKWVWEALRQADIRDDLAKVWVNRWRAHLHKGIPLELEEELAGREPEKKGEVKEAGGRKVEEGRSYILVDDMPTYVGKNLGDLTYEDAVDLARIRAGRLARASSQAGGSQQLTAQDILEIVGKVKEWTPGAQAPKSYMVTQGEQGAVVQEVEPGQPIVLSPPASQPGPTYQVTPEGEVKQLKPGEPIVVRQQGQPQPPKTYIVQPDGTVKEHQPGQPIIVRIEPSSNSSSLPALGLDKDGNPLFRNFDELIGWKRFESEEKRADERHKGLMEMVTLAKENLPIGMQALSRAASEHEGGSSEAETGQQQQQRYRCSNCKTIFSLPKGPWEFVACPSCGTQYSREDVFGSQEGA